MSKVTATATATATATTRRIACRGRLCCVRLPLGVAVASLRQGHYDGLGDGRGVFGLKEGEEWHPTRHDGSLVASAAVSLPPALMRTCRCLASPLRASVFELW